ncbi:MAG TPA: hypothetical protein DD490_27500 [Acidobacteria bacterium]|nr:hypothetical protein [Acidobacteriota bacterium]
MRGSAGGCHSGSEDFIEAFAEPRLGERHAAFDWFREQAGSPELARLRGVRPEEPLPRAFGLFDATGLPLLRQRRAGWLRLRDWLDDDEAILGFVFPEGLPRATRKLLLADLKVLRGQPWSPRSAVEAVLADWPADQPERDISLEAGERALVSALQAALAELETPR